MNKPLLSEDQVRDLWAQATANHGDTTNEFVRWFARSIESAILAAVRAERDELKSNVAELDALRDKLTDILSRTAIAIRGPAPPLMSWGWHDLPELAAKLVAEHNSIGDECQMLAELIERIADEFGVPLDFGADWAMSVSQAIEIAKAGSAMQQEARSCRNIPTTPSLNTQLANAVAAVASAQDHLARMRDLTARARSSEADALNQVNEAQRHFDALVAEVKKSAPRETDWRRHEQKVEAGS